MMLWVNIAGVLLIALIVWWFWMYKGSAGSASVSGPVTITVVDGVYQPSHIQLPANTETRLLFLRKDPSPCASVVVFDQLDLSQELPLNEPVEVALKPLPPGRYSFACQMHMYQGELIVEAAAQG